MDLNALFLKLGATAPEGRTKAESLCGIAVNSSYKWGDRVPSKHWPVLANAAGTTLDDIASIGRAPLETLPPQPIVSSPASTSLKKCSPELSKGLRAKEQPIAKTPAATKDEAAA